jgi:hypothetical protein
VDIAKVVFALVKPKIIMSCLACWTLSILATGDQQLLGVITNEYCIDWMSSTSNSITTDHLHPVAASPMERFDNFRHAKMKEVGQGATPSRFF